MKLNFAYKLLDRVDASIINDLKSIALTGPYQATPDFKGYTLTLKKLDPTSVMPIQRLFREHMSKFFQLSGHLSTNIARMAPGGYIPEHVDYAAQVFGNQQDSILKFQIPIITNPGAGLCWKHEDNSPSQSLFLEEGGIYLFNNCRPHSSVNLGHSDRYWLTSRWNVNSLLDATMLDGPA